MVYYNDSKDPKDKPPDALPGISPPGLFESEKIKLSQGESI
jgi:hypothetical protein